MKRQRLVELAKGNVHTITLTEPVALAWAGHGSQTPRWRRMANTAVSTTDATDLVHDQHWKTQDHKFSVFSGA
eukprot:4247855-Amphidinium_carterae.1